MRSVSESSESRKRPVAASDNSRSSGAVFQRKYDSFEASSYVVERLAFRAVAVLDQEQELRRGQHDEQSVLDALPEVAAAVEGIFPDGQQRRFFLSGDRSPEGARGERLNNLAGVDRRLRADALRR